MKEAEETEYGLNLCEFSKSYPKPDANMLVEIENVIKVLNKIITTTKSRTRKLAYKHI